MKKYIIIYETSGEQSSPFEASEEFIQALEYALAESNIIFHIEDGSQYKKILP